MDAITALSQALQFSHGQLAGTIQGVTDDQANFQMPGEANSIAAAYIHLLTSEDGITHGILQGKPPLFATTFAGKTGASEPPPAPGPTGWQEWAKRVRIDMSAAGEYARAVHAACQGFVASLSPGDLDRQIEIQGLGKQSLNWGVGLLIAHANNHLGEIAAAKGAQNLRGYPF
jgi:hypothetical protein